MNTTTTTATITQTIVTMYKEGQIEKGEELTKWAWSNRLPVSVSDFARTWQDVASTTEVIYESDEVTDGHEAEPTVTEEKKAKIAKALSAATNAFFESMAREHFGKHLSRYRAHASVLGRLSENARAKRFDKLLGTTGTIQDVWDLYERTYKAIGGAFVAHFAPKAMAPNEFIIACSYEEAHGSMPKQPSCPCCGYQKFEDNDAMPAQIGVWGMRASFWCMRCRFPLHVTINFEA